MKRRVWRGVFCVRVTGAGVDTCSSHRCSTDPSSAPSPIRRISPCPAPPSRSPTPRRIRRARRRRNETGNYTFPNVAAGTYRVDVTLPGFQIVPRAGHRRAAEHRRPRRCEAERRRASGIGARVGRCGAAADRDRGRADADDEPAAAEPADQRPELPEHADADARRRAAELLPDRRHQQPGARRCRCRSTARRTRTRCSVSTASARRTSGFRACRRTRRPSKRSRRSTSSPTASTPSRGWPAARR